MSGEGLCIRHAKRGSSLHFLFCCSFAVNSDVQPPHVRGLLLESNSFVHSLDQILLPSCSCVLGATELIHVVHSTPEPNFIITTHGCLGVRWVVFK